MSTQKLPHGGVRLHIFRSVYGAARGCLREPYAASGLNGEGPERLQGEKALA